MASPLSQHLAAMKHGEELSVGPQDRAFNVRYESEQALGDDNRPARGYTVGHYHVTGPNGRTTSFRHSPHGPTLEGAKGYAAEQAAKHIGDQILFKDRRNRSGPTASQQAVKGRWE